MKNTTVIWIGAVIVTIALVGWYIYEEDVIGTQQEYYTFGFDGRDPCDCGTLPQEDCEIPGNGCDWWGPEGEETCRCETWAQGSGGEVAATRYILDIPGYALSMSYLGVGLNEETEYAIGAIYDLDGNFVAETEQINGPLGDPVAPNEGIYTMEFTEPVSLIAGDYILAVQDSSNSGQLRNTYTDPLYERWWVTDNTFGDWPDPIGTANNEGQFLIWCNMVNHIE